MSDGLQKAIRNEMERQRCEPVYWCSDVSEVLGDSTCEQHEVPWDFDREACYLVADAVTAGWDAAIREAADHLDGLFKSEWNHIEREEGVVLAGDVSYCNGIAAAEEAVRSLLSDATTEGD